MQENIKIGARLLVPFGKRQLTGYAVALHTKISPELEIEEETIKDALELVDGEPLVTEEIVRLTQWTADYYSASWGEVLKASLPAGINSGDRADLFDNGKGARRAFENFFGKFDKSEDFIFSGRKRRNVRAARFQKIRRRRNRSAPCANLVKENWASVFQRTLTTKVKPKRRKVVRLLPPESHNPNQKPLTEAQSRIVEFLLQGEGEIVFTDLIEKADASASSIQTLAKRGLLEIAVEEVWRDPLLNIKLPEITDLILTEEQSGVLSEIEKAIETAKYKAFLLHGVTGSGKTEIYIRAMQMVLDKGKSAMMLVPEIALTPVFSRRLRAVFGDEVAILHSNLINRRTLRRMATTAEAAKRESPSERAQPFSRRCKTSVCSSLTKNTTVRIAKTNRRFITGATWRLSARILQTRSSFLVRRRPRSNRFTTRKTENTII
ncbi:MAG: DEAD/DEAH box helicase family protein [Hymenobacter sp.]